MPRRLEPYKKIAVALGGRPVNPNVIPEAVRLSAATGAKLYAIHMSYPFSGKPTMMMDAAPVVTEEDLRNLFRKRGFKELAETVPVKIYRGRNVAKLLARVTKDIDVLVIGHMQRNRLLAALMITPVHGQVMDMVSCPVMVVPNDRIRNMGK